MSDGPIGSASLSALDAAIDRRGDQLEQLVGALVSIDSQIPPYSDEREIVYFLRDYLADLGLGRGEVIAAEPTRPNLVVRVPGAGYGPTLMLNGHVDTKPIGAARHLWRSDPLVPEVSAGFLYGLGSSDMKAAVAAMVVAAAAISDLAVPLGGDLVLSFVADEEAGATLGSKFLAERMRGIDACVIGEPGGWEREWQGIHLVSRGVCCFRIRVKGTQMHSSLSDKMHCVNASEKAGALMASMRGELQLTFRPHPLGDVGPTLNVGVIVHGGVFFGVVPGDVEFGCDLRTVPGMSLESVHSDLERWLDRRRELDPELDVEVRFEPELSWVPSSEVSAEHPIVAAAQEAAAAVLGAAPPLSLFPGGTDAAWYGSAGIPSLPALGPGLLPCCHGPNECVRLSAVHDAARIYARTAVSFCGVAGEN